MDETKTYGVTATWTVKKELAQMLKGGVIMDVTNVEQAEIAEDAGAVAVMALERVPYDIRVSGGIARTAPIQRIKDIMEAVTIPVMAKARIGHYGEAQILEHMGVGYIDESEVLSPADEKYHIYKHPFKVPFVCGARSLEEALRRVREGASMIRTKGEPGTGDVKEAVKHMRRMRSDFALVIGYDLIEKHFSQQSDVEQNKRQPKPGIERKISELGPEQLAYLVGMVELGKHYKEAELLNMDDELMGKLKEYQLPMESMNILKEQPLEETLTLFGENIFVNGIKDLAIEWGVPEELVKQVAQKKGLPVVNFAAGGIAMPSDAALMMYMGADGIFVGSGIFKSDNPPKMAQAIVNATLNYENLDELVEAQKDAGEVKAMNGIEHPKERMQERSA